ncbi:MAG: HTH domain-containing protein [Bacteroides sp.]|nr:HTH domain-containing protein [Bacteroides sp.]
MEHERQFRYKGLSQQLTIEHLAKFISGIWQIHPFPEGNTRTTAVFTIKYLRSMGYKVENNMFKSHSWYFRNALVRSNYRNAVKGVEPTDEYLVLFLRNFLLGENNELKNRYLHILWNEELGNRNEELSSRRNSVGSQESSQEIEISSQEKPEQILRMLESNPCINLQEIANKFNMTRRGVQKITDKLKAEGRLEREGSTKSGKWIVKITVE